MKKLKDSSRARLAYVHPYYSEVERIYSSAKKTECNVEDYFRSDVEDDPADVVAKLLNKSLTDQQEKLFNNAFLSLMHFHAESKNPKRSEVRKEVGRIADELKHAASAIDDVFRRAGYPSKFFRNLGELVGRRNAAISTPKNNAAAHAIEELWRHGYRGWDELCENLRGLCRAANNFSKDYSPGIPAGNLHLRKFIIHLGIFYYDVTGKIPTSSPPGRKRPNFSSVVKTCLSYLADHVQPHSEGSLHDLIKDVVTDRNYKAFLKSHAYHS